jgi:hypothetical protein
MFSLTLQVGRQFKLTVKASLLELIEAIKRLL